MFEYILLFHRTQVR